MLAARGLFFLKLMFSFLVSVFSLYFLGDLETESESVQNKQHNRVQM
jgi:hypothetical protein